MIVVDRALYTWYRGDRRDEENTVATAASKTLAFASMKAFWSWGWKQPGVGGVVFCFFFLSGDQIGEKEHVQG